MNRLKVWVFTLLALAVAAVLLRAHSESLRADAVARLDARLGQAAAQGDAALRAAQRDATALAALAARDPFLQRALAPQAPAPGRRPRAAPPEAPTGDAAVDEASAVALASAAATLGLTLPPGAVAIAGDLAALERRAAGGGSTTPAARVRALLESGARAGFARAGGAVAATAAAPAGEGAAVAVLLPLAEPFVRAMAGASGVDVTLSAPETKLLTTGGAGDARALVEAARKTPGAAVGLGALGPVDASVAPVPLKGLPPLFAAPAHRARAVLLDGIAGGALVVSAATAPALAPVAVFEWRALAVLGALLLLGLLFGLLVRPSEILPAVPEELVAAAARIERGEFDARAPKLAGKLGTVAGALNRAATAAAAVPAAAPPDPFGAAASPPEAEPSAFHFPARPAPAALAVPAAPEAAARVEPEPAPASAGRRDGAAGSLLGGAFEAAPVPARAEPEPEPEAASPALASAPDLLQQAARAAAPEAAPDEEHHWREVFDDFLRVRAECGEPAQGLPYERFRQKLETNKASLVAKYGCRTVRFQVYVKDGKTALKATPVR